MTLTDWIGYFAAFLTTFAFLPQVWQILKTRHTKDISLRMYLIFICGLISWLVYGVLQAAWPIILANAITLVLAGTVLILKIRHG